MKDLALSVPTYGALTPPAGVPAGSRFTLGNIGSVFMGLFIVLGVILTIGFLVYGGILWTTSGGDKQKLEKARKTILYSIIGLIIIALAFVIINVVLAALGVTQRVGQ